MTEINTTRMSVFWEDIKYSSLEPLLHFSASAIRRLNLACKLFVSVLCCSLPLGLTTIPSAQAQGVIYVGTDGGYYSSPTYSCTGGITSMGKLYPYTGPGYSTIGGTTYYIPYGGVANPSSSDFPISCAGQIEAQFIWNGGSKNASPPKHVLITQVSSAYWYYQENHVPTSIGMCYDGFDDPTVVLNGFLQNGFTTQGTHTTIVTPDANGNVEVYCSPAASVPASKTDGFPVCGVGYTASLQPLIINLLRNQFGVYSAPIVLTSNTKLPIPFSVPIYSNAPDHIAKVALTIYDSAQKPLIIFPTQTITLDANNGSNTAFFSWDGTQSDGTVAPPGEYLYKIIATDNYGDSDTDKSPYLSLSTPATNVQPISDDGATAKFAVSYILASTDGLAASAGTITVYDPNQVIVTTQTLGTGDLTLGLHTVTVAIPSMQLDGDYIFLTSAQDTHHTNQLGGGQRSALQHNQKGHLPPIVYINSGIWHVAWCRAKKSVALSTQEIAPAQRKPHFVTNLVQQGTTLPNTVEAASNGSLFSYLEDKPPIGGIGTGTIGHWLHTYDYADRRLFSFGMTGTGGGFGYAPMKPVLITKNKKVLYKYTVATPIQQTYPYGFGCVGLLVDSGAPVAYNAFPNGDGIGQWDTKQLSPTSPEPRTALGWTKDGDFFIVTCNGINNTPAGAQGKTWDDVTNFFVTGLPQIIQQKYHKTLSTLGAVMLDGGGSTMFSYRNIDKNGKNIQTDLGAPTGYDPQIITDYVLAVGDTSK